jgi:hypothetical protein
LLPSRVPIEQHRERGGAIVASEKAARGARQLLAGLGV